jgi:hypothetical protein
MHERNTPVESLTVWSSESHSNELSSFAGRQHDTSQGRGQAGSGVQSGQEEGGRQPAHSESHPLSPIPQSRLPASTAWPDSQAAISSSAGRKTADTEIDLWPGNGSPGRNSISVMA